MLTQARLKELLNYDPETGEFVWRVDVGYKIKAGARAGKTDRLGYRHIKIERKNYLAHRLAWLYVHGEWPNDCIDHIDRDPSNNCLSNLRECSRSENQWNRGANRNGTHKLLGVSFHKVSQKWTAQIKKHGKVTYLGVFDDPAEAHAAYVKAAKELHGEFAATR